MVKRRLTESEKAMVRTFALEAERSANPGATVSVIVEDETDANGKAHWCVMIEREGFVPNV